MNEKKPMIICVAGRSGSGKSTLSDMFVANNKEYVSIESYTTREIRDVEKVKTINGESTGHLWCTWIEKNEPYNDIYSQKFEFPDGSIRGFKQGEVMAHTFFNEHHYFSTKAQFTKEFYGIDDLKAIFYVVDQAGIDSMRESMTNRDFEIIVLDASKKVVEQRLIQRFGKIESDQELTDAYNWIEKRMGFDDEAFAVLTASVVIDADKDLPITYNRFERAINIIKN